MRNENELTMLDSLRPRKVGNISEQTILAMRYSHRIKLTNTIIINTVILLLLRLWVQNFFGLDISKWINV